VALGLLAVERGASALAAAVGQRTTLRRLADLVRQQGDAAPADARTRLADCRRRLHAITQAVWRTVLDDDPPPAAASAAKLSLAEYDQRVAALALDVLGADAAVLTGPSVLDELRPQPAGFDPAATRVWVEDYLNSRARTIYGGASEIQRNTIAQQGLRLPRPRRSGA
jgi:alkylation response protein AidB-like acyl-CoA dehydrogenase